MLLLMVTQFHHRKNTHLTGLLSVTLAASSEGVVGLMQSLLFMAAYRQIPALGFLNRFMQVSGLKPH